MSRPGLRLLGEAEISPDRTPTLRVSVPTTRGAAPAAAGVRACADGWTVDRVDGPEALRAGPLLYPKARLLARPGTQADLYGGGASRLSGGGRFYKIGAFVKARATVTVRVLSPAADIVRLAGGTGFGVHKSATALSYHACPNGAYTTWPGGFDVLGRTAACVPPSRCTSRARRGRTG